VRANTPPTLAPPNWKKREKPKYEKGRERERESVKENILIREEGRGEGVVSVFAL